MERQKILDTTIIGAGPAGLVSAYSLTDYDIAVIEKGAAIPKRNCPMTTVCKGCTKCGEIEGVGGAGGWSDGKLCLGPVGILDEFIGENYSDEVGIVNEIFRDVLKEKYVEPNDCTDSCFLKENLSQEVTEVANLGTSTIRLAFERMHESIVNNGKDFIVNDRVVSVSDADEGLFSVKTKLGKEYVSQNVIVSTGKCDFFVVPQLIERYKLETIPTEPTLGFRIAIPNEELARMKQLGNNPKLRLHLPNGDSIKTHCFCFGGEVMAYMCGEYFLVGGRADYTNPTQVANTNILYKFSSGEPAYQRETVQKTLSAISRDYPKNVLYQDLLSFIYPDNEPKETSVPPCRGGLLAPLNSYYPDYVTESLRNFIFEMADTYGMDVSKATIFGPASEWLNDAVATTMEMETARKGLYIVGDGAGVTQGIIAAAVTGYRAAHSIKQRL
jgi:hypothetical protein